MQTNSKASSTPLDVESFVLITFQPNESFYQLPFQKRLEELAKAILTSQTYFRRKGAIKGLFVAPEYLFKDMSKLGEERYFTHDEKKQFVTTLKSLSEKSPRLILAPGTICWKKASKDSNEIYYRNELFFFAQGNVQKYKKTFPHKDYDFDYLKDKTPLTFFKTGITDACIIDVNNIKIAVEICFDHQNQRVQKLLNTEVNPIPVQIHLIVADGITKVEPLKVHGALTVKIEKNPDPRSAVKNVIGTNSMDTSNNVRIIEAAMTEVIEANIKCYEFVQAPKPIATPKHF